MLRSFLLFHLLVPTVVVRAVHAFPRRSLALPFPPFRPTSLGCDARDSSWNRRCSSRGDDTRLEKASVFNDRDVSKSCTLIVLEIRIRVSRFRELFDFDRFSRNNNNTDKERGKKTGSPIQISKMLRSNFKFERVLLEAAETLIIYFIRPRRRGFSIPAREHQTCFESSIFIFGRDMKSTIQVPPV